MFNLENGSEIETVPDSSEFLGSTLDIRDNDSALVFVSEEGQILVDGFITESTYSFGYSLSIRSCLIFFNFVVEILLILT
jgi:hypothetical protein